MISRRIVTCLLAFTVAGSITANASAQLLPSLPLQSILGTINTAPCTFPLLSTSSKVDGAVQRWAGLGGSGTIRLIVSAHGGLPGTVEAVVAALGLPVADAGPPSS